MRAIILFLAYYIPLIALSLIFYNLANINVEWMNYIMSMALVIIWGFTSVHAWEKSVIHRRLWINQIFHPESRFYQLFKGGFVLILGNALKSLPLALFLLLHLLQLELYEWIVIYLALALKIVSYHWLKARFQRIFVSSLNPYLARVFTDYLTIAVSYTILIYGYINLVPHVNLAGLSIIQVMTSAEQISKYALESGFYQMIYYANLIDSMYLWAIQNLDTAVPLEMIFRRGLIVLFAIQHFIFILMMQKVFNGTIMMVNGKHHLSPISQLDQSLDQQHISKEGL